MSAIRDHKLELLMAIQIFMQKWAEQYSTNVQLSFMPELFPGMRLDLVGHDMQVYCGQVTHTFDWEQGFTTSCVFMAPSSPSMAQKVANMGSPAAETSKLGDMVDNILGSFGMGGGLTSASHA
jgi:hypothetical protein